MTVTNLVLLFSVLFIGALIPSVSSMAVLTRTLSFGFVHGASVSVGIVLGDITFIMIAIFGLSLFIESIGSFIYLIQYLGAGYIILLGYLLLCSNSSSKTIETISQSSLKSSFLTGLLITLGDQKAILFYLGFFPSIFDLTNFTDIDIISLLIVTIIAVGGAKLCYAYLADRARLWVKNSIAIKRLNTVAASILISVGLYILVRVLNE